MSAEDDRNREADDGRERQRPVTPDLPDNFSRYDYYRYMAGGSDPDIGIRVLIDKDDYEVSAETMDPETGEWVRSMGMLDEIEDGRFVLDSNEEEINRLNTERIAWVEKEKREGRWKPKELISYSDFVKKYGAKLDAIMNKNRVVLFRRLVEDIPIWTTTVEQRENGDIAFCSGGSREWYAIVPAAHTAALRRSVLDSLPPSHDNENADLLQLLGRKFASDAENPFEGIKKFLDKAGIVWKHDFW